MKQCKIDKLCSEINAARGLTYPSVGYLYYANVKGDGRKHRTLYQIVNPNGGVCVAKENHRDTRQIVAALELTLTRAKNDQFLREARARFDSINKLGA